MKLPYSYRNFCSPLRPPVFHRGPLLVMLSVLLLVTGCENANRKGEAMPTRDIIAVMNDHVEQLMARPDVVMVAIGQLPDQTPCIQVYVRTINDTVEKEIGATIEGHPVDFIVSDEVRPLH